MRVVNIRLAEQLCYISGRLSTVLYASVPATPAMKRPRLSAVSDRLDRVQVAYTHLLTFIKVAHLPKTYLL
jgi:hypothetical protein